MSKIWERIWKLWLRICQCHRSDDTTADGTIANFFVPRATRGFFIRLGVVVAVSVVVFGFLLLPCFISGASMEPTVKSVGLTFCWRGKYLFGEPKRGDIVIIKYDDRVFFLKRIVALPGETVEFRNGDLYINGVLLDEPYVKFICDWNMAPRQVEPGHFYAVGDNRSMPMEEHKFGQVSRHRIIGAPIW